jgi:nucleoporin GLE1
MERAWNHTEVALDARDFIIRPSKPWSSTEDPRVSGVFIYILNMLVKICMKAMVTESQQMQYDAVDPIGIVLSWVISSNTFHIQGNAFSDILISKFHKECPPLFGIFGPEKDPNDPRGAGRLRLGWKPGDTHQQHYDRMAAMANGWASVTLRNYKSVQNTDSALPAWLFWNSVSGMINIPPAQLTATHGVIFKAWVERHFAALLRFYGSPALAQLRIAIHELPLKSPTAAGFEKLSVAAESVRKQTLIRL